MSDFDSDDEQQRQYRLTKTHQLIQQLENKLQSCNDEIRSPSFNKYKTQSRDSNIKSKLDLEKELQDFEQRIKQIQSQTEISQSNIQSSQQPSPEKMNHVIQMLSSKLESLDDDKITQVQNQLDKVLKEQNTLELEQINLIRMNQQKKFELESLMKNLELEEQQTLNENRILIMREQEEKLFEIQEQSERLLQEEEIKKQNFYLELQQLSFEKNQIQTQLNKLMKEQELLSSGRDDVSQQLNNLMQVHNQMLQNDLKKKMNKIDEESESMHTKPPAQLEHLYLMNQQLQENMNQQLSMIRQELTEQKQLNQELLTYLNGQEPQAQKQDDQIIENIPTQQEESPLYMKYTQSSETKQNFNKLFEKHLKQQFRPALINRNFLKDTKSTIGKFRNKSPIQDSAPKSKSKSVSKERQNNKRDKDTKIENKTIIDEVKKDTIDSFQKEYKKHIENQVKRLNSIVQKSLKN
ncbi:hypothetical protein pb186bvf_017709 [Paramecium bursaria]